MKTERELLFEELERTREERNRAWTKHQSEILRLRAEKEELIKCIKKLIPHMENLAMQSDEADEAEAFAQNLISQMKKDN